MEGGECEEVIMRDEGRQPPILRAKGDNPPTQPECRHDGRQPASPNGRVVGANREPQGR